ncbi:MAG: cytochrome c peroxidase [Bacteroidia bacterium]
MPKTELGRLLFYDPILSGDKDVASNCHHPAMVMQNIEIYPLG